jgi:hypothetical protein
MIKHLEHENCLNGPEKNRLYWLVGTYKESGKFMYDPDRKNARLYYDVENPAFFCPSCENSMSTLAGLFQHFENANCYYTVGCTPIPEFLNYMFNRLI